MEMVRAHRERMAAQTPMRDSSDTSTVMNVVGSPSKYGAGSSGYPSYYLDLISKNDGAVQKKYFLKNPNRNNIQS